MNHAAFILFLRGRVKEAGSQRAFAESCSVSEAYLSDILRMRRSPGPKILDAVGYKRVISYEQKEPPWKSRYL